MPGGLLFFGGKWVRPIGDLRAYPHLHLHWLGPVQLRLPVR